MKRRRHAAPRAGRERSQRQLRVGEVIRHALVEILSRGELRDPDLDGVSVTVTEVRTSPDLRNATAFVMPLGGVQLDSVVAALNRAAPYFRRELGHALTMKFLPQIHFVADTAFEYGRRIDDILRSPSVARDLDPHEPGPGPDDA